MDDGALQLIKQGLASYADTLSVTNDDAALPANSASVCYFAQLLDEHGNPSPLAPIGCINVAASAPPAVPMLAPLEAAGNALDPQMKVSWFCPPAGVDRYEVCIAADGQAPAPNVGGTVTPDNFSLSNPQTVSISEGTVSENFGFYRTPKAAVLGGGGALFTRTVNVQSGVKYFVFVRSVLNGGDFSPFSNVGEFTFHPPPVIPPPGVAWPQRPLPGFTTNLYPNVAVYPLLTTTLNTNIAMIVTNLSFVDVTFPVSGVRWIPGIHIGDLVTPSPSREPTPLESTVAAINIHLEILAGTDFGFFVHFVPELAVGNPLTSVFKDAKGKSLLPAVLYRTQVPNVFFPRVSGDLIQVTPQMSGIAHVAWPVSPPITNNCLVIDPFINGYRLHIFANSPGVTNEFNFSGLFLVDTQPRLIAATYAYLLVRFSEYGEVRDVIPCGLYTEPAQP